MKILINDYAGHPFQFDLSRELARRGHEVRHCYSSDVEGAKASFGVSGLDSLTILPITIGHKVRKYQFHLRLLDEIRYGRVLARVIMDQRPDVVLDANIPLHALTIIRRAECMIKAKKIYWLQDMIGYTANVLFRDRWIGFGLLVGKSFLRLEAKLIKQADHIVAISEGFLPQIEAQGGQTDQVSVIHNWAPIDDMPLLARDNVWRKQYFADDTFVFLYSGTLGLKHNPMELVALAEKLKEGGLNAIVVVVSEGIGADWLKRKALERELDSLLILPYQPFDQFPQVLAAGDVLLTLLDNAAGAFSVPSKILSYMCAGKPQLAAIPMDNLGATIIRSAECGVTVLPGKIEAFVNAGMDLYESNAMDRQIAGDNARIFAEENFQIQKITGRFEALFD